MIAGYHLVWTAYEWWLPNDPRGSASRDIRCAAVAGLGELHYGRKRIQPAGNVLRAFHEASRALLKHALLTFDAAETAAIGEAFAAVIGEHKYTCYACAIVPDHVHLLIRKHRHKAEVMIEHFQDASREAVVDVGRRLADHPVWGGPGWKVFLDARQDVRRVAAYIRNNPRNARLPEQAWPFVQEYDGWLPGQVRIAKPRK